MKRWISFLRGVNVGGGNRLPMKEFRAVLEEAGYENVETYIQSGNIVFDSSHENYWDVSSDLTELLREHFDITPRGHVYAPTDLKRMIQLNPFREEGLETPKTVHFFFLSEPAKDADLAALEELKAHNEAFELTDEAFYLLAPDGIGRSKLVEKLDRTLGVPMTGRNMRTVYKVAALAGLEVEDI
ncbi:MAG: DUF1697 domain-containing protein [Henriciella sp.]|uniref:DUF1697 domain-containing protein n=1 Tax=Henriciella sp. TaxID=1968823 RepID=UPI00261CCCB4|nr:DUF1697 domain-containing protein [Henriciella sp.]